MGAAWSREAAEAPAVALDPCSRTYRFGSCVLDLDRGTLESDGRLVPVRAKTYALLAHLAANAGRVLGKDVLLDAVWPDVTVTEDSLTQAIRDLRRAIGDEAGQIVRTVPRRGYLFAIPLADPAPPGGAMPRVAVLPFRNLTGDEDTGVLLDGVVEEITNGLARFKTLAVIARHSAFAVGAQGGEIRDAGARLGADYIVEGSVRTFDGRLSVAVALGEAAGGRRLWGETFEATDDQLLALPELIPRRIVGRLARNLEEAVLARCAAAPPASLSAFEHFTRAVALLRSYGDDVNERGREHLLRAIELDPNYGLAHAYLGLAEVMIADYGLAPRTVLEAAKAKALTGVGLAPEESRCHRILGYVRSLLGEFEAAEDAVRRAHELNSFDAEAMMHMSSVLDMRGRCAEALEWIDRAIALNPLHPPYYHHIRSYPLYQLGRYDECAAELALVPRLAARAEVRMAAALAMAGREEAAVQRLDRAETLDPDLRHIEAARASYRCERSEDLEHILTGIRAALDARARLRG